MAVWDEALASTLPTSSQYVALSPEMVEEDMAEEGVVPLDSSAADPTVAGPVPIPPEAETHSLPGGTTAQQYGPGIAKYGTCDAGWTLYHAREKVVIRNWWGLWLYDAIMKKRWCSSEEKQKVGTTWSQMKFKTNDAVNWVFDEDEGGKVSRESYDNRRYHLTARTRTITGCNWTGWPCDDHTYRQNINSWYDGGRISWTDRLD